MKWVCLQNALSSIKSAAGEPSVDVSKPKRRYFYRTSTCGLLNKKSKETRTSIKGGWTEEKEGGGVAAVEWGVGGQ